MNLRPYQVDISIRGADIIARHKILCLAMEVRLGKTYTSMEVCRLSGAKNVLFLTKKKAISSIQSDYDTMRPPFDITITNYESIHKVKQTHYDFIICDESHTMSAFPKPSLRAKQVRQLVGLNSGCRLILMTGTLTPESYSQIYHQFYVHPMNPFRHYINFYRWADDYVHKFQRKINGLMINEYSKGNETKIMGAISSYVISYTQKEAGFSTDIDEEVLYVEMSDWTKMIVKRLERDLVVDGSKEVILGDTPVKLMQKLHQLWSGTVKFESENRMVIDYSKAEFIRDRFSGTKIGIFYKFKAELDALMETFGPDNLTSDLDEFNATDKSIALQIVSGREGISLKNAKYLVFYNIDFSAVSYWQARDRMTTIDRMYNKVYWIFSKGGIEDKIYSAVKSKKNYTLNIFKKDYTSPKLQI
jgi:hypothetical protein